MALKTIENMKRFLPILLIVAAFTTSALATAEDLLSWSELPPMPDKLGLAGPYVGIHNDTMIVAGGANFPKPIWESEKVWHDRIYVMTKDGDDYAWKDGGTLHRAIAYGASVSTSEGVVCIGGNNAEETFDDVFLLSWDPASEQITRREYPSLPKPCAFTAATIIGEVIYLAGGQSGQSLDTAMTNFWSLDLSAQTATEEFVWKELPAWPGPPRALNLTVSQHNGYDDCVYVISGRRQNGPAEDQTSFEFLRDVWEFNPSTGVWRQRSDAPRCWMAGTSIKYGQSHVLVLGGSTGDLFFQSNELQDDHPGFGHDSAAYHTITDTWVSAGVNPVTQVTTTAVQWGHDIIVPTGEIRPRTRTPNVYRVAVNRASHDFGVVNYVVLFVYLTSMVGVGVYFARKNKNTDDFFRGGSNIPWWAAGCSIFATMLSSLTFTGIPSKSYAQDWVYSIGNFTIPVVAIVAVYVAMPFFRRIDATSAYEYLEKRFSRPVRLFGSASFTLFHLFRMAVVMSLTGLAMAVATPLSPAQSVLLMGVLSILYCTMGGVEAVIWTDTIQTVVLFGGAMLAIFLLVTGTEGGVSGFLTAAEDANKFRIANLHLSPTNAQIALWVIIVGALGQNLSSYTADQAVVQRYMTTADQNLAARSIWTNAALTIPSTLLFFGIGTALFAYYQSNPGRLDPTISTDQVFPYFIAREMPIGLAGLVVAGVFAAAQSTVSTSMNSTATALVTDFLRPFHICKSEHGYLNAARGLTFVMGVIGTLLGLVFVNPDIKSLFDTFLVVIGLFMGVLGGLFVLGGTTIRANSTGAMTGALVGAAVMFSLWKFTAVNGYLYTTCGITTCLVVGYFTSLISQQPTGDLSGLTIHTLPKA